MEPSVTSLAHISPESVHRLMVWFRSVLPCFNPTDYSNAHQTSESLFDKTSTAKGKYLSFQHLVSGTKYSPPNLVRGFKITFVQGSKRAE